MPVNQSISEGDSFTCARCQSSSFAKLKTEYEGFTIKRSYLVCAFCQAELYADNEREKTPQAPVKKPAAGKLSSLFGEAGETDKPVISELLEDDKERRFCKNCRHNFITPFKCHCNLHQKEVEPLHDCQDFEPKRKVDTI
jgi:hypothetical protein